MVHAVRWFFLTTQSCSTKILLAKNLMRVGIDEEDRRSLYLRSIFVWLSVLFIINMFRQSAKYGKSALWVFHLQLANEQSSEQHNDWDLELLKK